MDADVPKSPIRFGIFELDLISAELRKQGLRIKLQEQPFQALVALLERPQEVVTREELQRRLWPDGTIVDFDRGLNKAINRLREVLGDDADSPRFIETLPQRGYRFIAQVEKPEAEPVAATVQLKRRPDRASVPRRWLAIVSGLAALLLVFVGVRLAYLSFAQRIESIAVLPLENLSGNPAQEYFSDGMTDELIGELARIGSLRVISRTSVMQYKGARNKSLPAIARELRVDAIVEGTVSQSGDKVRITAQLIRAHDDRHLWSQRYERDVADVLALQDDVARAIAREIQVNLTPEQQTSLARTRRVKPEAYEAYLKGNYFLHKGIFGVAKSVEHFAQATKLDPTFAEAYAGLAEALCFAGIFGLRPSAETYPEARVAALKALQLDESNAAAHNALADVKKGHDWDLAGAVIEYQRAIRLNASHLMTRLWYAECLSRMGRHDDALAESQRAIALDPVSPISHNLRAMLLWRARRHDDAIQESQQALDLDPNFVNAYWWQSQAWAGKRDFDKAIDCLRKAISMNDGPLFRALLGHVYGRAGKKEDALRILDELTAMSGHRFVSPVDIAVVYVGLGDTDSTFRWLEKAYQTRTTRVHELSQPYYDSLRSDPRYADLMKRIGLRL